MAKIGSLQLGGLSVLCPLCSSELSVDASLVPVGALGEDLHFEVVAELTDETRQHIAEHREP